MITVTVSIDSNGNARQLIGDDTPLLVSDAKIRRVSHVEPINPMLRVMFYSLRVIGLTFVSRRIPCLWRVNLSPVNGPILPNQYRDRQTAISAEVDYLTRYWL